MRWFAVGFDCSPPSGNWSVASWVSVYVHFFFDSDEFIAETLFDISSLHGEDWLEGILFTPEDLYLLLVVVELVGDVLDLVLGEGEVLRGSVACLWGRQGWSRRSCRCRSSIKLYYYQQMPFQLGAKKAGLSLVRSFLHSIEGVKPYPTHNPELWPPKSSGVTPSITNSKASAMARSSPLRVLPTSFSCYITGGCLPMPRG